LRQQVEHDLERLLDGRYFDGCDWYFPFVYDPLPTLVDHLPSDTLVVWLELHDLDADAVALEERWQKIVAELVDTGDLLRPPKPLFAKWDEGRGTRDGEGLKARLQKFLSLTFTAELHEPRFARQFPIPDPQSPAPEPQSLTCHRVEAFFERCPSFPRPRRRVAAAWLRHRPCDALSRTGG
jgi:hypothetical protein